MTDERKRSIAEAYTVASMGGWEPTDAIVAVAMLHFRHVREVASLLLQVIASRAFGAMVESLLDHADAPPEAAEPLQESDRQCVNMLDLASVNLGVFLQAGRRFANEVGRDMTKYFEALKVDAVIGPAMEHMTNAGPADVQDIAAPGWTPPEVETITAMFEGVYREARNA